LVKALTTCKDEVDNLKEFNTTVVVGLHFGLWEEQ